MPLSNQIPSSRLIQPGVVDSAATRPASPFEGQCIFQKDTDQLLVWNGAAWVIPNSPAQNPMGLEFISNTAFSNVPSITVPNCFSTTYDNYHVSVNIYSNSTSPAYCSLQLCANSVPTTSGYYSKSMWFDIANAATFAYVNSDGRTDGFSLGPIGYVNTGEGSYDVDIHYPLEARNTRMSGHGSGLYATAYFTGVTTSGLQNSNISFNGLKLLPTANNITGTIAIYGYRK